MKSCELPISPKPNEQIEMPREQENLFLIGRIQELTKQLSVLTESDINSLDDHYHQNALKRESNTLMGELITNNTGLIHFAIKKSPQPKHITDEEIFQEALVPFIRATHTFKLEKGKFSTYVMRCVKNHFLNLSQRQKDSISSEEKEIVRKVLRLEEQAWQTENQSSMQEKINALLPKKRKDQKNVSEILALSKKPVSLTEPIKRKTKNTPKEESTLEEYIPDTSILPEEQIIKRETEELIRRTIEFLMKSLSEKEQEVIKLKFGLNFSLSLGYKELTNRTGMSLNQLRALEAKVDRRLKKFMSNPENKDLKEQIFC